jgi:hypothetical protein
MKFHIRLFYYASLSMLEIHSLFNSFLDPHYLRFWIKKTTRHYRYDCRSPFPRISQTKVLSIAFVLTWVCVNMCSHRCTNPSDWGCERKGTHVHVLNPITSARIRTVESFSFCYGKVEVRAKLPTGDWLWPGKGFTYLSNSWEFYISSISRAIIITVFI